MEEIWRTIPGFEKYQVSDQGRVRSLAYNNTNETRVLRPGKDIHGYSMVILRKNGKSIKKNIHRLVLETFALNLDLTILVHHKNGIRTDNRLENLEWMPISIHRRSADREKLRIAGAKGARKTNLRFSHR